MRHETVELSEGWAGTDQTVETIQQLVEDSLQDPAVVQAAHDVVRNVPERDRAAEIRAVSSFVRSKIRYTSESIETIKTPRVLVDEIRRHGRAVGDCDDSVVLWAALLRVLGFQVRFHVVSQRRDGQANHIFGEVFQPGRGWVSDDTIVKNRELGWRVPAKEVTKEKVYGSDLGLGGTSMHKPMFRPGGTRHEFSGQCGSGTRQRMLSGSVTASEYAFKTGSNLVVADEGSGMGFLPALFSMVSAGASAAKKVAAAKAAAKAPITAVSATTPTAPVQRAAKDNTMTYVLIGGGLLAAMFLLKR